MALFGSPSLGKRRSVPKGCGKAIKAPRPKTFTSPFDGFAFAPASAGSSGLPAGTALFQSSAVGAVGCGVDNNLYLVTTYKGPRGSVLDGVAYNTTTGKQATLHRPLKPGRNATLLFAAPSNATYQLKADVIPPPGTTGQALFTQSVTLQRTPC